MKICLRTNNTLRRLTKDEVLEAAKKADYSTLADVDRGEPYQISEPKKQ